VIGLLYGANSLLGQGLLIIENSQSHSDTPHSVGLPWKSDQLDAETSTWQHTTLTRPTFMIPAGFEHAIQQACGRRPTYAARPTGDWSCSEKFTQNGCGNSKKSSVQSISHPWYESHILEDGTVRLSRNVCKELPLFAA